MSNRLSFAFDELDGGAMAVTPCIDGERLTALVSNFETEKHYDDPCGGYGGLVPEYFRYGPLDQYFVGRSTSAGISNDTTRIYVLGCECGEVGCWPLVALVTEDEEAFRWSHFAQPYRPNRDYTAFGPFVFRRSDYLWVIQELELRSRRLK